MPSFAPSAAVSVVFWVLVLAGCTPVARKAHHPAPETVVPLASTLGAASADPATAAAQASLLNREPDTCKAADHVALLGQPGDAVARAGIAKPVRLVHPATIVDQEEYESQRVNFHLNEAGIIVRMNCG